MGRRGRAAKPRATASDRLVARGAPPTVLVTAGEQVIDLTTWANNLVQLMLRQTGIDPMGESIEQEDVADQRALSPWHTHLPEAG